MTTLQRTFDLLFDLLQRAGRQTSRLAPLGDLAIRLWVAKIFWASGLTKFQSWETTLLLFQYEYQVPLLSPAAAAVLATASELVLSALLALGLAGRLAAFGLSAVNVMAVISYPALNPAGLELHYLWGLMLLIPLLHGPGKLSLDHVMVKLHAKK